MVNSIEDIIELHKNEGDLKDTYIRIHIDDRVFNLNIFTMDVTSVSATKEDILIWEEMINSELRKDKALEKEVKEFRTVFDFIHQYKIRSGYIQKGECPDFIIKRDGILIGLEITKIYVGYD